MRGSTSERQYAPSPSFCAPMNLHGMCGTCRHPSSHHFHVSTLNSSMAIPSSKTDVYGNGVEIHLAASLSPLSPVTAIRTLHSRYPALPDVPVFNRNFGPFSKRYSVDKVHKYLLRAGLSTLGFSGHWVRRSRQKRTGCQRTRSSCSGDGKVMRSTFTSKSPIPPPPPTSFL